MYCSFFYIVLIVLVPDVFVFDVKWNSYKVCELNMYEFCAGYSGKVCEKCAIPFDCNLSDGELQFFTD